jgi:hypothetical protein
MKKTESKKQNPQKSSRVANLFRATGLETTLAPISDEELTTVVGGDGDGPKLPKASGD